MRAMVYDRYGGPEVLRAAELPDPVPRANEVLVRVSACSLNLSDWEALTGSPAYARLGGAHRPRRPVLGSDVVGEVVLAGTEVVGLEPGRRVMADVVMKRGGLASLAVLPAAACAVVPEELDDVTAACLPQSGPIALQGMADVHDGQRVLINGAGGGAGTLALQLALAAGARVTAVDNSSKLDWLADLGVHEVLDHRRVDVTALGRTWDLIIDLVATRGPRRVAPIVADGGRYRAVGGAVRVMLPLALAPPWTRRRVGVLLVRTGAGETARAAEAAVAGRLRPLVDDVLPLEDLPRALARVGAGQVRGKVVIRPGR